MGPDVRTPIGVCAVADSTLSVVAGRMRRPRRRDDATTRVEGLGVFCVALGGYLLSPAAVSADSLRSVFVGMSMYRRGDLDISAFSPSWTMGTDFALIRQPDAWLPFFAWAPSLFVVPVLAATDLWMRVTGRGRVEDLLETGQSTWPFELVSMSIVGAVTAVLVWALVRDRVAVLSPGLTGRRAESSAVVVALAFAFGTVAWSTSSRSLWQHGPAMLFTTAAIWAAVRLDAGRGDPRRTAVALGLATTAAFTMRPTSAVLLGCAGLWLLVRHRGAVGWAVAGGIPVALAFVAVNLSQYGQVLPPYFVPGETPSQYRGDLAQALAANLFSPARGLFVFSPVLLLAILGIVMTRRARRVGGLEVLLVAVCVVHWVAVSSFPHWWGGYSYGPRFMSDVVPPLLVLALPVVVLVFRRREREHAGSRPVAGLAAVLLTISVVVHAEGALTRSAWCWNSTPDVNAHVDRLWDWSDAQVTAGVRGVAVNGWGAETVRGGSAAQGCEGLSR